MNAQDSTKSTAPLVAQVSTCELFAVDNLGPQLVRSPYSVDKLSVA
jgi:hypothetical protein